MVFYRAVWPANLGASGAETLSEKLPSWSGLASGSAVLFILPVFSGGSRDPPACLGESRRAVRFLVKEDKTQADKRRRRHLSVSSRQLAYLHCAALWPCGTHSFLPGVSGLTISTDAQTRGTVIHCALRSAQDRGGAGRTRVQSFPAVLRCSEPDAFTYPTLLLWFLQ